MLRVVGAGLPRTGTQSLKEALELLLGRPWYHMREVFAHPEHVPVWHAAALGRPPDWREFLAGYAATLDAPAAYFWPELSEIFPDAIVLLSVRDADSWWESASETVFRTQGLVSPERDAMNAAIRSARFPTSRDTREAAIRRRAGPAGAGPNLPAHQHAGRVARPRARPLIDRPPATIAPRVEGGAARRGAAAAEPSGTSAPGGARSIETNYAEIARRYDRTRARRRIGADPVLAAMIDAQGRDRYRALDLGCGTGNYLLAQIETGPTSVGWDGLDASPEMLDVARGKLADRAVLTRGSADSLPYGQGAFHFIMLRAVFHHILEKERALDEIIRVLRPGGWLHIRNAAYEYRKGYWVYRYFPETRSIDERRFWPVDRLFRELENRGMRLDGTVTFRKYTETRSELLLWARNRDLSQLALLGDAAYEAGLSRLADAVGDDIPTEDATLDLTAVLRS